MNGFEPEEFERKKRLVLVALFVSLIIQVIVLLAYYFKEKQVMLALPMLLGILITVYAIANQWNLGK